VTLGVELFNDRDIVVSQPESGFSVTYRKDPEAPMLVAIDGIGRSEDAKLNFWVQAWKAAYQKARARLAAPLVSRSLARSPAVAGESFPSCCMSRRIAGRKYCYVSSPRYPSRKSERPALS
jgi:hypothetical protein